MKAARCLGAILLTMALCHAANADDRSIDGTGNNLFLLNWGASDTPFIRFNYRPQFFGPDGGMPNEDERPSARTISNLVAAQPGSRPSARRLSNYIWAWGQFLTHDISLSTTSDGTAINGTAPIPVNDPLDPLGPNAIPFTRANFFASVPGSFRTPINEVTSYIDASNVYGSDAIRAAALRTNGGSGAKLLSGADNLLPRNSAGLPNENNGPLPEDQLFLAGDIRSNENSLLTSLHTVFMREHNRLVDVIAAQQPHLDDEQQYQLARKIVGAEMQIITYKEFLPALLGNGPSVPKVEQYTYSAQLDASVTTAFSHAAFRFGHSAVTSELNLIDDDCAAAGSLALRNAFFNPHLIGDEPGMVNDLLRGAARQTSEEIDTLIVDDLRNFLFGPPGAGGLDLAALNVQRARDAGLPTPVSLSRAYGFQLPSDFSLLTSDPNLAQALTTLYGGVNNIDTWIVGLAQDHTADASVSPIFKAIIESQFRRLRDGDRLFYRANAAGLYVDGILSPEIAAIIDLDQLTLADIIRATTEIDHLQNNIFFVPAAGDFNGDGAVDAADYVVWRKLEGTSNAWADADGNGTVGSEDFQIWANAFSSTSGDGATTAHVPEPSSLLLLLAVAALLLPCNTRNGAASPHGFLDSA